MTQSSLELFQKKEATSKPGFREEIDVIRLLRQRGELGVTLDATDKRKDVRWVSGKAICEMLGWMVCESSRRKIRKIAEQNSKRVITGNKGYMLLQFANMDEVQHAANRLEAHGKSEIQRAVDLRNAYHAFGRTE